MLANQRSMNAPLPNRLLDGCVYISLIKFGKTKDDFLSLSRLTTENVRTNYVTLKALVSDTLKTITHAVTRGSVIFLGLFDDDCHFPAFFTAI